MTIALVLILAGIGLCLLLANDANRERDDDRWLDEDGHRWPPGGPSRKGAREILNRRDDRRVGVERRSAG